MLEKLKLLLLSRKFYAAMLGSFLVYVNSQLSIVDPETMTKIVALIGTWIIGQGIVDANATKN